MSDEGYAGFWLRVVAFIIDAIVLSVVYLLLIIPVYDFFAPDTVYEFAGPGTVVEQPALLQWMVIDFSQGILVLTGIVYYTIMEASRFQATVGKMAMELRVTDGSGRRLTFSKSLLRNVSKLLSSLLLMAGHIAMAFTKRKQALHDFIANALVMKH